MKVTLVKYKDIIFDEIKKGKACMKINTTTVKKLKIVTRNGNISELKMI